MNTNTTLWQRWQENAYQKPAGEAIVHWIAGAEPFRWQWEPLLFRAERYAYFLASAGVGKQDVCALILRHDKEFYPIYMGIEALGALPAVLAYPNPRLHPLKFRHGLEGMARHSGLDWILTEHPLESVVRPLAIGSGSSVRDILLPLEWTDKAEATSFGSGRKLDAEVSPLSPCLLQHSSGTTGLQKGVMLSHKAVLEHVDHYGMAIALSPQDKIVSWLPLYHDMGLIASFHLPLACGIPFIQLDPFEWVCAPVLMLEAASRERATLSWLPNFAYNLMADRIHEEDLEGIDLSSMRMLVNCSEPVRFASHEKFARRFGPYGLKRKALAACYAMAETTFAVTQTPPGIEAPCLDASRKDLSQGRFKGAGSEDISTRCVSSGAAIAGCEIRIVNQEADLLPDGRVGEILIRSTSMFDGYRNNPEKTAEVLQEGWYASGDLGFSWKGECYVLGREKDILIIAGKNIYPEDIEFALAEIPGVIPGRVIAFGIDDEQAGTEQVCVVAETAIEDVEGRKRLRSAMVAAGMEIDVTISRIYLAPPRWLFKSSSGKPSRSANKQRALEELCAS